LIRRSPAINEFEPDVGCRDVGDMTGDIITSIAKMQGTLVAW